MALTTIFTQKAPEAVGPYSQAVVANGFVFCSGQVGLKADTKDFAGEDVPTQTRQALENLSAVLEEAGSSLGHVVKTTVFLADMADFQAMNSVYGEVFGEHRPARSTIAVKDLPLGARVEIEAVAVVGEGA